MARNRIIFIRTCLFEILGTLPLEFALVFAVFSSVGGGVLAADFSDTEDGFPAVETGFVLGGGVAETGGGEGAFGPAVVDAGEVPVYFVGGGVSVELVADVDEVLDGCDVDVVDGGKVEDDGFEGGFVGFVRRGTATAWAWVVPGTVLLGL